MLSLVNIFVKSVCLVIKRPCVHHIMRHNGYNFEFELSNKQRLNIEGECLPEGEPEI